MFAITDDFKIGILRKTEGFAYRSAVSFVIGDLSAFFEIAEGIARASF